MLPAILDRYCEYDTYIAIPYKDLGSWRYTSENLNSDGDLKARSTYCSTPMSESGCAAICGLVSALLQGAVYEGSQQRVQLLDEPNATKEL